MHAEHMLTSFHFGMTTRPDEGTPGDAEQCYWEMQIVNPGKVDHP
jgi:hypothetical protein